jgi:hypothetical protein
MAWSASMNTGLSVDKTSRVAPNHQVAAAIVMASPRA